MPFSYLSSSLPFESCNLLEIEAIVKQHKEETAEMRESKNALETFIRSPNSSKSTFGLESCRTRSTCGTNDPRKLIEERVGTGMSQLFGLGRVHFQQSI
jgi:hypothetical protein